MCVEHNKLAIGCAAGFGGDCTDAAAPIVETLIARGGAGVLMFEMLAERTRALAQRRLGTGENSVNAA
jgi:IMP dehydrogenase/GMP reductase